LTGVRYTQQPFDLGRGVSLADQFGALPLYLSQYIEAHKSEYYASLKAAQQQLD